MRDYSFWMNKNNNSEELAFDLCEKSQVFINDSNQSVSCVINDANEWQDNVDNIILLHKSNGSIKQGDYIRYDGNIYIIFYEVENRNFFWSGKMRKCNNQIKWKNSQDVLYQYNCIAGKTSVNVSRTVEENKFLNTLDGKMKIIVPKNIVTSTIKPDYRFIIGSQVYKIIGYDDISYENLIEFTGEVTQFNNEDDKVNGLASNNHLYQTVNTGGDLW